MIPIDPNDGSVPRAFGARFNTSHGAESSSRQPSSPLHPAGIEVARRVNEALLFLLEAREYADDVGADSWDFALELRELRSLGLTTSDLRWLAMKGYVEFAVETTMAGDDRRSFRELHGLTFGEQTCFVITAAGVEAATTHNVRHTVLERTTHEEHVVAEPAAPKVVPHWDSDLQELRVNGVIVKQFKVPAPNQEMVLSAFQEESWPARIDDPLPPQAEQDPKRRLHDTIVSLNRNHKQRLIRFMGDGSGEGVRWTRIVDAVDDSSS